MVYGTARAALLKLDPQMPDFSDFSIRRAFSEWMEGISTKDDPLIGKYRRQFEEVGNYFGVPLGEGGMARRRPASHHGQTSRRAWTDTRFTYRYIMRSSATRMAARTIFR